MAIKLNVTGPFHTALLKPASDKLAVELEKINIKNMDIPVLTNAVSYTHLFLYTCFFIVSDLS